MLTEKEIPEKKKFDLKAGTLIALFALYIIWGSTYLAISVALEGFPPFLMAGLRFIIAGGGLYFFLLFRGVPNPSLKLWGNSTLIGALLLVCGNAGVVFAEKYVASAVAAVAVAAVPIWAALFAGLWGRWPRRLEWLGLFLGTLGVVLLNLEGNLRASPVGAIFLIGAPMCWAFGSIFSRHISLPVGFMASGTEMFSAGVLLLIISLLLGERITALPSWPALLALLYLIVFGSLVAFSAYNYLLVNVRPTVATSYAYANPLVAVALGIGFHSERLSWIGLIAMPVILAGVALVTLRKGKD